MRSRGSLIRTLIALLVAGGVWAAIYHFEYHGEAEGEGPADEKDVFSFDRAKVAGVAIARPEGVSISLAKEGQDWRLTAPLETRADADKVASILSSLDFLRVEQEMPDVPEADLPSFKLDRPQATVTVRTGEGEPEQSLRIGDKVPVGSGHYAARPGTSGVLVVSGGLDAVLGADASSLRFKKVVGVDAWQVQRFRIEAGGSVLSVARQEEEWRLEAPVPFPADRTKVQDLWFEVQSQEAAGFEIEQPGDEDLARFGLARPALALAVESREGAAPVRVVFGRSGSGGEVFARRSDLPSIMRVNPGLLEKLEKAVSGFKDLRDTRVAPIERWKITGLEIRRGVAGAAAPATVTLVKDAESAWRRGGAEGPEVPSSDVNAMLDAVEQLKAEELLDSPGASAQDAETLALTLREGEGEGARSVTARVIAGGAGPGGLRPLSSSASTSLYLVSAGAVATLMERAAALEGPSAPESPEAGEGAPADQPAAPGGASEEKSP